MRKDKTMVFQVLVVLGTVYLVTCSSLDGSKQLVEVSVSPSEFKKSIGFENLIGSIEPKVDVGYEDELRMRTESKIQTDVDIETALDVIKEIEAKKQKEQEDIELLAKLVRCEAGNQSLEGKRAVVDVVLNRVDSKEFPNTIREVIFQKGQFTCVIDGNWEKYSGAVDESDYEAVRLEMEERSNTEIIYFSSGECSNGKLVCIIGDHYFAKR